MAIGVMLIHVSVQGNESESDDEIGPGVMAVIGGGRNREARTGYSAISMDVLCRRTPP